MKNIFEKSFNPSLLLPKDFKRLLITRGLLTMTLQMHAVIIGWKIYQIKKSALLLGLIGMTEAVPAITMAFFAGHFVDINKPDKILNLSLLVIFLNSIFLLLAVLPFFNFETNTNLLILFMGVFISGAARAFTTPSLFSLIPRIVPRSSLAAASAFNGSIHNLAAVVAPALGGLIYGFAGEIWAFIIPCILSFLSYYLSRNFSQEIKQIPITRNQEPITESIKNGLKFLFKNKVLLSTMVLDMFSVLFGGVVAVLPIFADQIFKVGPIGLGFLRAAPAIGTVLITTILAVTPLKLISGSLLTKVVFGFGFSTILFALTSNFYLAMLLLILTGIFDGISIVLRGTFMQLLTPGDMRGRVSSLSSIFITSSNEIGAFESGLAASFLGLIPSVIFGGVMTVFVVFLISFLVPELNKTKIEA